LLTHEDVVALSVMPTPSIVDHLLGLHEAASKAIDESVNNNRESLGRLLQLDIDIKKWELRLQDRPETAQLSAARRDLAFAIYAASSGAYSHAYSGLRLFLELSFASVYFSANELARRRWVSNRQDFSWSKALDQDEGILAPSFVQEFNVDASPEARIYAARAAKCYRECSQFLHGKITVTKVLPETLSYSEQVLRNWITVACDAAECTLFLLFCRYGTELLADDDGVLHATLEYSFSHLMIVRKTLGLPVDEESRSGR
jgi:hypothetical protein